ncbi:hypothetical protein CJ307_35120, partial [Klebsiella quasipneumoniae]
MRDQYGINAADSAQEVAQIALIASGQVQPGQIWGYTPSPDKVAALRDQYGINAADSAQEVAQIA